jgi:hypothetical protein
VRSKRASASEEAVVDIGDGVPRCVVATRGSSGGDGVRAGSAPGAEDAVEEA